METLNPSKIADPSDKHVKPSGGMVECYVAANDQYKKGETIPVTVNGYRYEVTIGSRNTIPQEVLSVLQNAKSKTAVPDLEAYDPSRGGVPRKQEDFFRGKQKFVEQSEWDIEVLKERN